MKVTLSLDFNPDHDSAAIVTVKSGIEPIMAITYCFNAGPGSNEHHIIAQTFNGGELPHYTQAKLILAGSELVDSIITGKDAPSTIEL